MSQMNVKTIQTDLAWHDAPANQRMFETLIRDAADADLIVLPEMFLTGFTMEPETLAQSQTGPQVRWLIELARETDTAICGSLVIESDEGYRNRFMFVTPDGRITRYDKRHLFRMGKENEHYEVGTDRVVIHYRGWRIMPTICYDLRFPVWCRNQNDYDLLICVANWPAPRRLHWRLLLQARAVENQAYVIGVNRIGRDGKGLEYAGDSMVVSYKGDVLVDSAPSEPYVGHAHLNLDELQQFRETFPAWADADQFEISRAQKRVASLQDESESCTPS